MQKFSIGAEFCVPQTQLKRERERERQHSTAWMSVFSAVEAGATIKGPGQETRHASRWPICHLCMSHTHVNHFSMLPSSSSFFGHRGA